MPRTAVNTSLYNEAVPMEFTRALLAQARAYNKDVQAILRAARFPFDPLRQDAQTAFVSREQYSRLCLELIRELGDESGGVMPDVQTPVGTTRLILLSMLNSSNLAAALHRSIEFNATCRVRQGAKVTNGLVVDAQGRDATLSYLCSDDLPDVQHSVLCNLAIWLRFSGWLIGHTHRFKAAVPEQGVYNMVSMWGTSDAGKALLELFPDGTSVALVVDAPHR